METYTRKLTEKDEHSEHESRPGLRCLDAQDCAQVAGGWGEKCYYSGTSGSTAGFSNNSGDSNS